MRGIQINWEIVKEDVGGRWFLDRKSMLALVPFLILTSLLSSSNLAARPELWQEDLWHRYAALFAANIVSIAICWVYLELASATVFGNRSVRPVGWGWVLSFGLSIGFLKGLTTGLFSFWFGSELSLDAAISNRVFQTSMLGLWTIPAVALIASILARYRAEREALINERLEQALKDQADGGIPEHQLALRKFIQESKEKISELKSSPTDPTSNAKIAATLRQMIETGLRPISHQIWATEKKARSGFGLLDLSILALGKNPFPLPVIGISFVIGLLPLNIVAFESDQALYRTAVTVTIALASYSLFLFAKSKVHINPLLLFGVGNVTAATLSIWLTAAIFGDLITAETVVLGLALLLWLSQLSFFGSLIGEVLASRAEIRSELEALTGKAGLSTAVDRATNKVASRDLAQHVHSNIQNQLLASALKIEQSPVSAMDLEQQLLEVENLLDQALESSGGSEPQTLRQSLDEVVMRWQGFVDITLLINPQSLSTTNSTARTVVQVISEAVSNSVRHGLASSISIELTVGDLEGSELQITVVDDGLGPRSGAAGLGTELFSAVSNQNWSIQTNEAGGSVLKLQIPVRS